MYVRGEKESKNEERVGNRQKICEHYTDQNYDLCARVAGKRRKKGGSYGWDRRACAAVRRVPARQKRRAGDCGFVPAEPERFIPDINVARSILSAEKWIKQDTTLNISRRKNLTRLGQTDPIEHIGGREFVRLEEVVHDPFPQERFGCLWHQDHHLDSFGRFAKAT